MNELLQTQILIPSDEMPVEQDSSFSYDGYQVVRGEFFAHLFEPSVTLNKDKVSVNAACIRKLPKTEYVQFLVNPAEKKLAVKPSTEDSKDSFRWSSIGQDGKRKPKDISCKIFFAKIMQLMDWDPSFRYKILGKLIRANNDLLFVFDLTCAEAYRKRSSNDDQSSRRPFYPEDWNSQFGVPVREHQDTVLVNIFDDYTVFRIQKEEEEQHASHNNSGYEEKPNTDSSIDLVHDKESKAYSFVDQSLQ